MSRLERRAPGLPSAASGESVNVRGMPGFLTLGKRGTAKAVLLSVRDSVHLSAKEREVLRVLGEESQRKGRDKLTLRQIDDVIKAMRSQKRKRE